MSNWPPTCKILGLDPGLTTGVALLLPGGFTSYDTTPSEAIDRVRDLLTTHVGLVVAVERFTPGASSQKKTRQNDALEIIGACRVLTNSVTSARFMLQGAGDARVAGSPRNLKRLGWWVKGVDHRNKAAAQVALAALKIFPAFFEKNTRPLI